MAIDDVAARGFQAGAAAYEIARPGYPDEAVATLATQLGITAGTTVCDLAAGTGKLTRRLVELGATVTAVEPVEGDARASACDRPHRPGRGRHRRGDPAPGRVGRCRHRRPGVPLVRRRRGVPGDRPRAEAPWRARDPVERAGRAHRLGRRDESDHPLARAHGVPVPARRLGRDRRGVGALHRPRGAGGELGAADDAGGAGRPGAVDQLRRGDAARRARAPRRRGDRAGGAARPSRSASPTCAACSGAADADRAPSRRRARVVAGAAPRPAVAPDAGPVGGARVRGDGPADAGRPGRRAVAAVPRPVPDARGARRRPRRRGRALLVGSRVQPTSTRPAPLRPGGRGRARRAPPGLPRCPPRAAGRRSVHGPRRAGVRLRARPRDRRHQHRARARPLGRASPPTARGAGGRRRVRATGRGLGVEPGDARPRGERLPAPRPGAVPAARSPPRVTGRWPAALRPTPPTAPRACRGCRAASRGATARAGVGWSRPCASARSPPPTSPRPWAGPTTRTGRHEWRRRWSTTASSATRRAPTASRRT